MMNKYIATFLLIIFLSPVFAYSQTNDTKLWTGLSIEKKINKKFNSSLELEQRFHNNISSFDKILIEPSISYKLNKKWSLDLTYRLWYQQKKQNYFLHSRASLGLSFDKNIKGIKFKLASKLQYGIPDRIENDSYATKKLVSRNSFKLSYEIFGTRYTPYIKYEVFTSLNRFKPLNYQWRMIGGTDFYINSKSSLRLYYILEHEYNVVNRTNANTLGLSLRYRL